MTSAVERHESVVTPVAVVARNTPVQPAVVESAPAQVVERPETLPQTASKQPLIALMGLLALGAAGALAIARRLNVA